MGWFRCKPDVMVFEVIDEVDAVAKRKRLTVPATMTVDEIEALLVLMGMVEARVVLEFDHSAASRIWPRDNVG